MGTKMPEFEGHSPENRSLAFSGKITSEDLQPEELLPLGEKQYMVVEVDILEVGHPMNPSDGVVTRATKVKVLAAQMYEMGTVFEGFPEADEGEGGPAGGAAEYEEFTVG